MYMLIAILLYFRFQILPNIKKKEEPKQEVKAVFTINVLLSVVPESNARSTAQLNEVTTEGTFHHRYTCVVGG